MKLQQKLYCFIGSLAHKFPASQGFKEGLYQYNKKGHNCRSIIHFSYYFKLNIPVKSNEMVSENKTHNVSIIN